MISPVPPREVSGIRDSVCRPRNQMMRFASGENQGWIQHDLVGGGGGVCSGADCRVVSVMCAARPSTTVFEL